jgi:hypothetical protein
MKIIIALLVSRTIIPDFNMALQLDILLPLFFSPVETIFCIVIILLLLYRLSYFILIFEFFFVFLRTLANFVTSHCAAKFVLNKYELK